MNHARPPPAKTSCLSRWRCLRAQAQRGMLKKPLQNLYNSPPLKQSIQLSGVWLAGLHSLLQGGAIARIALWISVMLSSLCSGSSAENSRVMLTNVAQIFFLPKEQIEDGKTPVRVRGMVTYYEPGLLFVQDGTAGVFVYHTGERLGLRAGQYLEVTGMAAPGLYTPIIASPKFQALQVGPTILPRPVSLAEIDLGSLDAQWVEFTGLVRGLRTINDRFGLELAVPPHRITVWMAEHAGYEQMLLVGSYVRVRGVVATSFVDKGPLAGFQVFANTLSD